MQEQFHLNFLLDILITINMELKSGLDVNFFEGCPNKDGPILVLVSSYIDIWKWTIWL